MILHCNFEELRALAAASELIVADGHAHPGAGSREGVVMVEQLLPRLTGDVSIETLDDQRRVHDAVAFLAAELLRRLDDKVIEFFPAHEEAVALYFDYAYTRGVLARLEVMGAEMAAIIELIAAGNPRAAGNVTFPD